MKRMASEKLVLSLDSSLLVLMDYSASRANGGIEEIGALQKRV